jgi:hypothetical protein
MTSQQPMLVHESREVAIAQFPVDQLAQAVLREPDALRQRSQRQLGVAVGTVGAHQPLQALKPLRIGADVGGRRKGAGASFAGGSAGAPNKVSIVGVPESDQEGQPDALWSPMVGFRSQSGNYRGNNLAKVAGEIKQVR